MLAKGHGFSNNIIVIKAGVDNKKMAFSVRSGSMPILS